MHACDRELDSSRPFISDLSASVYRDGRKKNDAGKEVAKVVGASYVRTVCH